MNLPRLAWVAAAAAFAFPLSALAHVDIDTELAAGATGVVTMSVNHGCGTSPTVRLRVALPEGLENVKPQPKPGWELTTVSADAEATGGGHSHSHSHETNLAEIIWSGGSLPDAHYDEFAFRATIAADAPDEIRVPVVQECETGVERWIEIPGAGGAGAEPGKPAPAIRVLR